MFWRFFAIRFGKARTVIRIYANQIFITYSSKCKTNNRAERNTRYNYYLKLPIAKMGFVP